MTQIPGHTQLTAKALNRLATAIAAEQLGVKGGSVRVGVTDSAGLLAVQVTGPIRLAPLGALEYSSSEQHTPLLERVEQIRAAVAERLTALTGRRVASVILECTSAEVAPARRVQ
ncbi:hypothetical protein [Leucobacter sp. OH1287]|uniref:hypothetical protein n=1 Tax=Leucobacter sp. OH1287 TaxID=2491049 RepID=UPI000F5F3ED0|nr:hypothetical protein [Leucobacter sp. OH1287]RRD60475.1 hypothetical protein EII30_05740 [Leucobacter sp. OH1287]